MIGVFIGNRDWSDHVLAGSYDVNSEDVTNDWVDQNGVTHKDVIRRKVKGSFDMYFKNYLAFSSFSSLMGLSRNSDGSIPMRVDVNNTGENQKQINAFYSFKPVRDRNYKWEDCYPKFTFEFEER